MIRIWLGLHIPSLAITITVITTVATWQLRSYDADSAVDLSGKLDCLMPSGSLGGLGCRWQKGRDHAGSGYNCTTVQIYHELRTMILQMTTSLCF